jgi:hypothetical protein
LDQVMLIQYYRLIKWQRDSFRDMIAREEYYNFGADNELTITKLTKLTTVSLYLITISYQYKLLLRIGTALFYTHGIYSHFDDSTQITVNWVFFGLAVLSILLSLASGLVFLQFASMLNVAHTRKSLFDSGLNVDEVSGQSETGIINQSSEVPKMLDVDDMNRINSYKRIRPATVTQENSDSLTIK